jgi:hypothetical protein
MGMRYSSEFNLDKLRQNLFARQGRFNREMRIATEKGAEIIMAKSQSNSPVDTHNLEEAHHIEKTITAADHVRFTIEVSGIGHGSEKPRDVANYAMEVHENYTSMGPKSAAKLAAGHEVGGKYLERAIETEKAKAIALIRQAVRKNWGK